MHFSRDAGGSGATLGKLGLAPIIVKRSKRPPRAVLASQPFLPVYNIRRFMAQHGDEMSNDWNELWWECRLIF